MVPGTEAQSPASKQLKVEKSAMKQTSCQRKECFKSAGDAHDSLKAKEVLKARKSHCELVVLLSLAVTIFSTGFWG